MLTVRTMESSEREEVAALIYNSTNAWYQKNRGFDAFADPAGGRQIVDTYELLDPGCTLVVYDDVQKRIAGSCFYHPRSTHVSLGILNSHPDYAGQGAAKMLAARIAEIAAQQNKPLRLVSSAMNLDSFSVYSRLGFIPTEFFQDTILTAPSDGVPVPVPDGFQLRSAVLGDVDAMANLEMTVQGIDRRQDFRFFIENQQEIWTTTVLERLSDGKITGFLAAINNKGTTTAGPGCMLDANSAVTLIANELNRTPGKSRIVIAPSRFSAVVQFLYSLGAKNIETHISQCKGEFIKPNGVVIPCFLPESA